MKQYLTAIGIVLALAGLTGCEDSYEVKEPVFDVWTDRQVYTAGEPITFHIEGSPDMINFYSGTIGNEYTYYDKERIYDMVPTLRFRAAKYAGNNEDCAELLYTTDFNENYDFENVKSVNWINISDRFNIPPIVGTSASFSDAGTADISDLVEGGKPIYFAWYCKTNEASQRTQFQVSDFNIMGVAAEDERVSGVLYTQVQLDFRWSLNPDASADPTQPNINNTRILWTGTFNNTAGPLKEGYAVSGPVTIPDQINLGLDRPVVIKSVQIENMTEFFHTFDEPGEYEVAFVGYNVNFKGRKETVRKIKLTIEE